MPDSFVATVFSETFAKVIAETGAHIYEAWRREADLAAPIGYLERVKVIVRDCVIRASSDNPTFLNVHPVREFLTGPDFEYIAADMVASTVLGAQGEAGRQALRQCQQAVRLYGASPTVAAEFSTEFQALLGEILSEATWVSEANKGQPRDSVERRQLEEETGRRELARQYLEDQTQRQIAWRLATLTTLVDHESIDLSVILHDIHRLRTAVSQIYSVSSPTHIDAPSVIPIDKIYVGPILESDRARYVIPQDAGKLFEDYSRVVLLGDPGGGKTSLAGFLAHIATSSSAELAGTQLALPVTLREHSSDVSQKSGLDIVEAIQSTAKSHFQVELSRAEVEYICLTGRIFLILDGLDELLELRDRVAVTSSINAFAALYPRCPIFATSRIVGYEQAALDPSMFSLTKILSFNESQVEEYAKKWFMQSKGLTIHSRDSLLSSFLDESSSLDDLRSNPLLLSLMCSLYRHKRYIPKNRGQLYAKCAELLFDDWDRSRRLRQKFEFDGRIDGAVRHLAYWIFSDQERQSGVSELAIRAEAGRYLSDWIYGDLEQGEYAAKTFLDFCKNRAWVLTETGTAADGTGLFQFVHRTFLEYFTAGYIVNKFSDEEIGDIVLIHASSSSWHVVCQIVIQLASKKQQGLEDSILGQLCSAIPSLAPQETMPLS